MTTANDKDMQDGAQTQFAAAVKKQLGSGAKNWNGDNTEAVIRDYLVDKNGKAKTLPAEDEQILRLAVNPTVELQIEALKSVFDRANTPLNEYQLAGIRRVLNPQVFRQALIDAKKLNADKRPKLGKLVDILD